MKNLSHYSLKAAVACLAVACCTACGSPQKQETTSDATVRTPETEALLAGLKQTASKGIMFGHHDDTLYGIGWEGDEGRSDVKSVCGDYPAVISFDLGELELDSAYSLDKVPFERIRKEIVNQYQRGGLVSLSWHLRNPKTGGTAWDVSDSTVVRSVLPGGECHEKFCGWLTTMARFLHSLQTDDGVKVPVLFRPWHENTGSWFWWGEKLCSVEEYKALWRLTVDSFREQGVDNALYAYSPTPDVQDSTEYLVRYPGDDLIDVIGFDTYQFERDPFLQGLDHPAIRLLADLLDLRFVLLLVVQSLLFTLMFMILPNRRSGFWESLPGGLFSCIGWMVFSNLYSVYVTHFSGYANLYGSVYAIAISMLWLYCCLEILFFGGALNRLLMKKTSER